MVKILFLKSWMMLKKWSISITFCFYLFEFVGKELEWGRGQRQCNTNKGYHFSIQEGWLDSTWLSWKYSTTMNSYCLSLHTDFISLFFLPFTLFKVKKGWFFGSEGLEVIEHCWADYFFCCKDGNLLFR